MLWAGDDSYKLEVNHPKLVNIYIMHSKQKIDGNQEEITEIMAVFFITSWTPVVAACREALKLLK